MFRLDDRDKQYAAAYVWAVAYAASISKGLPITESVDLCAISADRAVEQFVSRVKPKGMASA